MHQYLMQYMRLDAAAQKVFQGSLGETLDLVGAAHTDPYLLVDWVWSSPSSLLTGCAVRAVGTSLWPAPLVEDVLPHAGCAGRHSTLHMSSRDLEALPKYWQSALSSTRESHSACAHAASRHQSAAAPGFSGSACNGFSRGTCTLPLACEFWQSCCHQINAAASMPPLQEVLEPSSNQISKVASDTATMASDNSNRPGITCLLGHCHGICND